MANPKDTIEVNPTLRVRMWSHSCLIEQQAEALPPWTAEIIRLTNAELLDLIAALIEAADRLGVSARVDDALGVDGSSAL